MTDRERGQYWVELWRLYYMAYFHEIVDARVNTKLAFYVKLADFVFGATASGSAIAAWTFWGHPTLQPVWAGLSGFAGTLAIVLPILGVRDLAKQYLASLIIARRLRLRIGFLRAELNIREDWDKERLLGKLRELQGQF